MAQTLAMINVHLPEVLTQIIRGYLLPRGPIFYEGRPDSSVSHAIGLSGYTELYSEISDLDEGIRGMCEGGYIELVEKLIEHDPIRNNSIAMLGACAGGHLDMVQLLIDRGFKNWWWGIRDACYYDRPDIVRLMINRTQLDVSTLNYGLHTACCVGSLKPAKMMLAAGATDMSEGLRLACLGGNYALVALMIKSGATHCGGCMRSIDAHKADIIAIGVIP